MFAPLRSVFAMQLTSCDMNASSATDDVVLSAAHCLYMTDSASADDRIDYQSNNQIDHTAKNCCSSDDGACNSECHFAVSASLFMQRADYSPVLLATVIIENVSTALLVRELNPPSRPPLSLHS